MHHLLVGSAALSWGLWALFLRPAGLPGPASALITFLVMSLPAPFVLRRAAFADRGAAAALVLLGVADAANVGLFFAALARGPVVVAVLTHYLAPLLVALASPILLGEHRSRRALLATPLVLLGLGLAMGPPGGAVPLETAALGAGSAVFYAGVVVAAKRAARSFGAAAVMALHSPVSALVLLLLFRGLALPPAEPRALLVVAGAFFCGLAGGWAFNLGLRGISAQAASALTYLEPVSASLVGVLAFGEPLPAVSALGAGLVIAASVYAALERPAPRPG